MSAVRRTPYQLRDASGTHVATHVRYDDADGKRMVWELPSGEAGLGGIATADLPLYGIDRLGKDATVVVVEGEKAADTLIRVGVQAVGTVTGASSTPGQAALAELGGRHVVLWPDNDDVVSVPTTGLDNLRPRRPVQVLAEEEEQLVPAIVEPDEAECVGERLTGLLGDVDDAGPPGRLTHEVGPVEGGPDHVEHQRRLPGGLDLPVNLGDRPDRQQTGTDDPLGFGGGQGCELARGVEAERARCVDEVVRARGSRVDDIPGGIPAPGHDAVGGVAMGRRS